ncbi:family 1 glycosylhydrolase [Streptomyces flaveolus]|uniref:beta-glucosidase n=1 Tax=Streptomyces flaveolus TaxID=67297 RepID=A0ABV1VER9_9ACTN
MISFPQGFAWGTATAAYQIEGAVTEDGRGPSIWDTFVRRPGVILNGDNADVAIDHYHRYRQDAELLAELGAEYYRFSVAWPRIMPTGAGEINARGLDFYRRLLDELENNEIRPWVTLYHWDLPQGLQDLGGWANRDTAYRFADFCEVVHAAFEDRVEYWTTLNEPFNSAFLGYASGAQAPGIADPALAVAAGHHLLLGHGLAVERLRAGAGSSKVGITLNLSPTLPASDAPADLLAERRIDARKNRFFLDPLFAGHYPEDLVKDVADLGFLEHVREGDLDRIAAPLDFLGVNYYRRFVVRAATGSENRTGGDEELPAAGAPTPYVGCENIEFVPTGLPTTSMGWEVDPEGLRQLLVRIDQDWNLPPIYITENGMSFPDQLTNGRIEDFDRIRFMVDHLKAAHEALEAGVDLRGYFAWSSFDNFEWALGLEKRFGLIHVDFDTQVRTPKASARWYAAVTRTGDVSEDLETLFANDGGGRED